MNTHKQSGLAPIAIILIIAGVLILGGGVYYWQKSKAPAATSALSPTSTPSASTDQTVNWQTYRNDQYGLEMKCPKEIVFKSTYDYQLFPPEVASPKMVKYAAGTPVPLNFVELSSSEQKDILFTTSIPRLGFFIQVLQKPANFSNLENFVNELVSESRKSEQEYPSAAGVGFTSKKIKIGNLNGFELIAQETSAAANVDVTIYIEKSNQLISFRYGYQNIYIKSDLATYYNSLEAQDARLKYQIIQQILSTFKFIK